MQSFLGQTILGKMTQYACFRFPAMIDSSKIDDEALCALFSENRAGKTKALNFVHGSYVSHAT